MSLLRLPIRWRSSSGSPLVDDEGIHALAGDARRQDAPARGACHVRVLALRVDDVGRDAARQTSKDTELRGEGFSRTRTGQDGGVGVEVRPVPGVVDDGGACPHVDAVEGSAPRVEVRRREGEQPGQGRGVQSPPRRDGVQSQRQCRKQPFALAKGEIVELSQRRGEVGLRPLGHLLQRVLVPRVQRHGERGVE